MLTQCGVTVCICPAVVRPLSSRPVQQLSLEEVDISREADAAALAEFLADTELDPEDPARELDSNPEDPARDIDSDPEDPARDVDSNPEDPARDVDYDREDPAMNSVLNPRTSPEPPKEASLEDRIPTQPSIDTDLESKRAEGSRPRGTFHVVDSSK